MGWEPPEAKALTEEQRRSIYPCMESDLFQLGMVLWTLALDQDGPELVERPLDFRSHPEIPDWYQKISMICLDTDPRNRLPASQLLQMIPKDTTSQTPSLESDETQSAAHQDIDLVPSPKRNQFGSVISQSPVVKDTQARKRITLLAIGPARRLLTNLVSIILGIVRWSSKSGPEPGYHRIEWTCSQHFDGTGTNVHNGQDCGVNLHADFPDDTGPALDSLAFSLQNPKQGSQTQASDNVSHSPRAPGVNRSAGSLKDPVFNTGQQQAGDTGLARRRFARSDIASEDGASQSKFLGICVNIGGIYKTLTEIDVSNVKSDAVAFLAMKKEYVKARGALSRFSFLIKPITTEFVQFTLWNLRGGYISICDRPNSIPPGDSRIYEYIPKPLQPLPPTPPEIFIHYLQHGEGDLSPVRNDWLPRLPKRLNKRVIDSEEACYGWGVHVIEGPNREVIFWISMATIGTSVLACVLWSTLQGDIQGGTGLGSLIVALPPAILAAFLFRLGAL